MMDAKAYDGCFANEGHLRCMKVVLRTNYGVALRLIINSCHRHSKILSQAKHHSAKPSIIARKGSIISPMAIHHFIFPPSTVNTLPSARPVILSGSGQVINTCFPFMWLRMKLCLDLSSSLITSSKITTGSSPKIS